MEWNFRTAQLSDLDRVTEIEYICFPAEQAATRAAFEQRIKTFPPTSSCWSTRARPSAL